MYQQSIYVLSKNKKKNHTFQPKITIFTAVKNHSILHRRVFVMSFYSLSMINVSAVFCCYLYTVIVIKHDLS